MAEIIFGHRVEAAVTPITMCEYCNEGDTHEDASGFGVAIPGSFGNQRKPRAAAVAAEGAAAEDDDGT